MSDSAGETTASRIRTGIEAVHILWKNTLIAGAVTVAQATIGLSSVTLFGAGITTRVLGVAAALSLFTFVGAQCVLTLRSLDKRDMVEVTG